MSLKPDDPCGGFQQAKVVAFINEKMAEHVKGPEFYFENILLSWEEVEDKLKAILEDKEMPRQAKEACTWGCLALGMRFAYRQGQLQGRRVQWLNDCARLHRSAAQALASDLRELTAHREMERKEAAFKLHMVQNNLAQAQRERDLYDSNLWSAVGYQGIDPQQLQRDRREPDPHHQRRPPVFHSPGDWECPWCKAVNFAQREVCFFCRRAIWLQSL
uniref:RanBP2-type domain-containing protein n=1 Tax=Propithecus coquereli TaxID=379532 RepID=A0A2K6EGC6_PROCO